MPKVQIRLPSPNPKQQMFLRSKYHYTCFGGARGGGKSWVVRVKALKLALKYPKIHIMILRSTFPELEANHVRPMREMVPTSIARYNESKHLMTFTNGSIIQFAYCANEKDLERYQGHEYEIIFIDEATNHDEIIFTKLKAINRSTRAGYPRRMYLTCNPGGKGHAWVKRLFIDKAYTDDERPEEYTFIQSLVTDNRALMKSQPEYIQTLKSMPPKLRAAWLYGQWDIFEGQFFEEFKVNPNPEHKWTHVIPEFDPPSSWKRLRSYDFGYNKPFSCGWWVVDHDGRLYRVLELYGCQKDQADVGVRWSTEEQFEEIKRIENEHPWLRGHNIEGVADPAIWAENGGVSVADVAAKKHVFFQKGDNQRIPGWMQMHYRMRFDENGFPMLYVFEGCKAFIRTVPSLIYDEHKPEDLDTKGEDHVADESRYMCMLNPITPRPVVKKPPKPYDPLDRVPLDGGGKYEFFRI